MTKLLIDRAVVEQALEAIEALEGLSGWEERVLGRICDKIRAAMVQPDVPEGYVLVPVEPTPEMCRAAVIYANGNAVYKNVTAEALKIEEGIYGEVYAAMLAATPKGGV